MNEFYNKIRSNSDADYAKKEYYWGTRASSLTHLLAKRLTSESKILELGTGEGRDAIYLARKGHVVTAADFSQEGIRKAEKRARKHNVNIEFLVANIADPEFVKRLNMYDGIVANNILHFLTQDDAAFVLGYIKEHTKPGGYVAISSLRGESKSLKRFQPLELYHEFEGWNHIRYLEEDGISKDEQPSKNVEIVAQKIAQAIEKRRKDDWTPTGPQPGDD